LLFDGLDEVGPGARWRIVQAIEQIANRHPQVPIVVTTRPAGYAAVPLDRHVFERAEIEPLDAAQRRELVTRWAQSRGSSASSVASAIDAVVGVIEGSSALRSFAGSPLLLTVVFELVRQAGGAPTDPHEMVDHFVRTLGYQWDRDRNLDRSTTLTYVLIEGLTQAVARHLERCQEPTIQFDALVALLAEELLRRGFDQTSAPQVAVEFVDFCRDRTWVLTEVGTAGGGEGLYGFSHLAFLEHFLQYPGGATGSD
jgi:predicted NACHT family NTPase